MIIKVNELNSKEIKEIESYLNKRKVDYNKVSFKEYEVLICDKSIDLEINSFNTQVFKDFKYKLVSRDFKNENTVIEVNSKTKIGEGFEIIAGPCSVEDLKTMESISSKLNSLEINFLRGGTYKPRTSPYDFKGHQEEGLKTLNEVGKKHNLITVSEILDHNLIEEYDKYVDIYQVGARNMQNYPLLKELGRRTKKPIILKRGPSATLDELLMSAEYIMLEGNPNIILCERGIRTFSDKTRNTLDLSAVIALKKLTHLPVIVDPSHGSGRSDMVVKLSLASQVVGADGVMVETHPNPHKSLSDPFQAISLEELEELTIKTNILKKVL